MRIHGTAFEITDLNGFVKEVVGLLIKTKSLRGSQRRSLLGAGGLVGGIVDTVEDTLSSLDDLLPDELSDLIDSLTSLGLVRPLANARINLGVLLPGLLPDQHTSGSFFPPLSVKTTTNAVGAYTLTVPDDRPAPLGAPRGFLLIYEPSGSVTLGGQTTPLFSLLYRSSSFDLEPGEHIAPPIFVRREAGRPEQAITQAEITKQTDAIKRKRKFDDMDAYIGEQKVAVRIVSRGAKAVFDIVFRGSSSPNLKEFIDLKVRNFTLDLPGPDFITTLCADEKAIEREARSEIASLERSVNTEIQTQIVAAIAEATSLPKPAVKAFFTDAATLSISAIRTPRQTINVGSNVGLARSIVLDVSIGIPRSLFATQESKRS